MAVDTTIPSSSNNVGDDLSAIQENFELLASAQVVDEGSTSDGDYIRYENGWQICVIDEILLSYANAGSSSTRILGTWSFPVDFNSTDITVLLNSVENAGIDSDYRDLAVSPDDFTSSSVRLNAYSLNYDLTDNNVEFNVTAFAIGRWK